MTNETRRQARIGFPLLVAILSALGTAAIAWVLVTMFGHKQDARRTFNRNVDVNEVSTDPALWGQNWPHQFDQYKSTAGDKFYGGSAALPDSKLTQSPWLKRLYAGYAFSIDYREARGHAYMLYDQVVTERVNQRPQAGACLHCHASPVVLYRKAGREAMGKPCDEAALAAGFDMEAVIKGFEVLSTKPYHEVLQMLTTVPDGTRNPDGGKTFEAPPVGGFSGKEPPTGHFDISEAHPMSCIDCHDPKTMMLRITRPGFVKGMAMLAASDDPLPHLPSVEKWRRGDRKEPYDPNKLATRHEMRTFTCAQCHVEYYCAPKDVLEFPWAHGLKTEDLEKHWEEKKFPDGAAFMDYLHTETGTPLFKAQHPEFELWSQGTHARAGVSCADCHMPYERVGAMKLSNHKVQSPMENINNACQTCHHVPEADLVERVDTIQNRTKELMERAATAMTDMLDAIVECQKAGASEEQLRDIRILQRKAMWRLDYISSENSRGFHAAQESARVLGESIDFSRQAQAAALKLTRDLAVAPAAQAEPDAAPAGN
jgi:nitrite reductase (cytochrome c-552)